MRRFSFLLMVFLLLPVILVLLTYHQGCAEEKPGYAGAEKCKECHFDLYSEYENSVHNKNAISWSPANREGCESCHGPGKEHIDKGGKGGVDIFGFNRQESARQKAARCLACHEETKTLAFWNMNRHSTEDVACNDCHSVHSARGPELLKSGEPYVCFDCHRNIRAKTDKQSHHPIREGRIKCTDCHDPMGTFSTLPMASYSAYDTFGSNKMIRADAVNELCYKCHAEKRGPQVWTHPPVEESCLICHQVHGSNHSRLLDKRVPQLCQSCHDVEANHVSTPYTKQSGFRGNAPSNHFYARACLNCHTNVHGSNSRGDLGSHWLR
jgi:DmsE family decaheme c-type cytochrome